MGSRTGTRPKRVYSKARLQRALDVYHRASLRLISTRHTQERHLREDYQFRRVNSAGNFAQAISWYDDDSSDEYCPTTAKKRRLPVRKIPKAKRIKHEARPTKPASSPEARDGSCRSLVTLKLTSSAGRALLSDIANKEGTGSGTRSGADGDLREGVSKGSVQLGPVWDGITLETRDQESDKICGGTNRSGFKRNRNVSLRSEGPTESKNPSKVCYANTSRLTCEQGQIEAAASVERSLPKEARTGDTLVNRPTATSHCPSAPAQPTPIQIIRAAAVEIQQARDILAGLSRENPIVLDSPRSSPEASPQNEESTFRTFTISTPWAHPINFKYLESLNKPCHFCEDFRYGIFGYGVISVEVIQFMEQPELQEMGNGHRAKGKEATRISEELHRKYITQLTGDSYPQGPALRHGVYPTCSLCSNAALWSCCADQRVDKYLRKLNDGQVRMDRGVLKRTTVQEVDGYDCRRADMEFLFAGSLLHKAWA
ncbi:hypothetical protein AYO21_06874 [Fonsecaea monophora]|uniref:Uncharacterized protein n=1 Tax=Fonsecaea monophora TaxID=254056 RepID=A0A177F3I8_9EURO|nr:hypothetical protein AYO21_06874 [Fonsecaea monophora]OAG38843.1 hypothetical protein AYO21_06874 [Fonsecaea monophora]